MRTYYEDVLKHYTRKATLYQFVSYLNALTKLYLSYIERVIAKVPAYRIKLELN